MFAFLTPALAQPAPSDTLTVDVVNGGLFTAARILTARHGVAVDFEEPPLDPRLELWVVPAPRTQDLFLDRVFREVRFDYPAAGGVDAALDAAVTAWNALGAPGTPYVVSREGRFRRLVPTTRTLPDGTRAPYTPPLSCEIRMDAVTGESGPLLAAWVATVNTQCGAGLENYMVMYQVHGAQDERPDGVSTDYVPDTWTLPAFRGPARDQLDVLVRAVGTSSYDVIWNIGALPGPGRLKVMTYEARPQDETSLNRTPLGSPPLERHTPPRPAVAIPYEQFEAYAAEQKALGTWYGE